MGNPVAISGLFGKSVASQTYSYDYNQSVTGAPVEASNGAVVNSVGLSNVSGSSISFYQESPAAIAALLQGTKTALDAVGSVAGSATDAARLATQRSFDLAGANSGTTASQFQKILMVVAVAGVAVAAIYFLRPKK